jgi:hypothetical protein
MIHMGQMILSEPSIIIIWTYQDMMEWMSRILDGEISCADEDFGAEVGQMWVNFGQSPNHKSNSDDPHGPEFRILRNSVTVAPALTGPLNVL